MFLGLIEKHFSVKFDDPNCISFFTAGRYTSGVYAVVVCPADRLSVCLSQAGTVPKRLNAGSRKQRHTIVHDILYRLSYLHSEWR